MAQAFKFDSVGASAIWGRVAAGIGMVVSVGLQYYGYDFAPEAQQDVVEIGSTVIGLLAAGAAIYSKVKESKKITAVKK